MTLVLCLGILTPRQTCAQSQLQIDFADQAECLDAPRLRGLIEEHLGETAIPEGVSIEILGGAHPGFSLRRDGASVAERRFDVVPRDCGARHSAFAVVIALAIENAVESGVFEARSENHGSETVDEDSSDEWLHEASWIPEDDESDDIAKVGKKKKRRGPRKPLQVRMSGGAGYTLGVLPEPALIGTASAAVRFPSSFVIGMGMLVSQKTFTRFETDERLADGLLPVGESTLMAGRLDTCWEPNARTVGWGYCSSFAGGFAGIGGTGGLDPVARKGNDRVPWLAVANRLSMRYPARGNIGVLLSGDIYVNLIRPGLLLKGVEEDLTKNTPIFGASTAFELFFVLE